MKLEWGPDGTFTKVNTGTDALPVQDGGNSLTVDDGGSTISIDDGGSSITVDVVPGTGATNLGKAEDAAHTSGDVGVMMLGVRNDNIQTLTSTDGDYSPIAVDDRGSVFVTTDTSVPALVATYEVKGAFYDPGDGSFNGTITRAAVSANTSGQSSVVSAPGAGLKIIVFSIALIANAANNVKFQSSSTDKTGLFYLPANGGFVLPHNPHGWIECAENEALNINLSAAQAVGGVVVYANAAV